MLEPLYHRRNSFITTVVDGSIFKVQKGEKTQVTEKRS